MSSSSLHEEEIVRMPPKYPPSLPPKTLNDQKSWIKKNIKNSTTKDFIIIDKKNHKKIGTIGFNNLNSNSAEWGRWISKGHTIQNIESINTCMC